jgi:glyoxylase-like metal-dependent hydrolase (beta-lactamase superfamily II)
MPLKGAAMNASAQPRWTFTKGLHDLGDGAWAYLQPDGGWGWSNAGLIVDGDQSLLVDTLFDMTLTREMLAQMTDATGLKGDDIDTVVNTHANGDHTHGNGCCEKAEIIASAASLAEMEALSAAGMAAFVAAAPRLGAAGAYVADIFGGFDFAGVVERLPTRTFSGELELKVGDKPVRLIEVGPAHTKGDVLVHLPDDRKVFTGDILFIDGTPIMWAGPVANWIAACDRIMAMDADVIVPGHGPITDKAGVRRVQDYLAFCDREARKRFDAGLSVRDAAHDIALGDFSSWGDSERIAVNVDTLYRQYRGDTSPPNTVELFGLMAELRP